MKTTISLLKADRRRQAEIVAELSRLSRNGWRDAKLCDYIPLQRELRRLEAKAHS